jgi:hypothetical protein
MGWKGEMRGLTGGRAGRPHARTHTGMGGSISVLTINMENKSCGSSRIILFLRAQHTSVPRGARAREWRRARTGSQQAGFQHLAPVKGEPQVSTSCVATSPGCHELRAAASAGNHEARPPPIIGGGPWRGFSGRAPRPPWRSCFLAPWGARSLAEADPSRSETVRVGCRSGGLVVGAKLRRWEGAGAPRPAVPMATGLRRLRSGILASSFRGHPNG